MFICACASVHFIYLSFLNSTTLVNKVSYNTALNAQKALLKINDSDCHELQAVENQSLGSNMPAKFTELQTTKGNICNILLSDN
jgi:hypothetical protein